jgi:hypothetical protein
MNCGNVGDPKVEEWVMMVLARKTTVRQRNMTWTKVDTQRWLTTETITAKIPTAILKSSSGTMQIANESKAMANTKLYSIPGVRNMTSVSSSVGRNLRQKITKDPTIIEEWDLDADEQIGWEGVGLEIEGKVVGIDGDWVGEVDGRGSEDAQMQD